MGVQHIPIAFDLDRSKARFERRTSCTELHMYRTSHVPNFTYTELHMYQTSHVSNFTWTELNANKLKQRLSSFTLSSVHVKFDV